MAENIIKTEAEDILQKLGVPVSVVINSLYRQIISSRCSTELHSFYSQ